MNIDRMKECEEFGHIYSNQEYHCETERQYVSNSMGISSQQVARYQKRQNLIPEIQDMINNKKIQATSCTDQIAYKSHEKQMAIYNLLNTAYLNNIYLSRDNVIKPIATLVEGNPNISWEEVQSHPCIQAAYARSHKTSQIKERKKNKNLNQSTHETAERFVNVVLSCIKPNGYSDAEANSTKSRDYKCDIKATNRKGQKVVMQLKYHQQRYFEGITAVIEADQARKNYHADIAIAVTSTSFSKLAKKLAEELDVRLWDRQYLMDIFGWDGTT